MRSLFKSISSIAFTALFASSLLIAGCAARVGTGYRVYDPYYGDYHVWDNAEVGYYGRWENETHRGHVDFRKRPAAEQKEYWTWRHGQH